ncbi:MAG: YggS family pyridoxal phosphate-dependent enzyme [Ruminococcus sp.]|nr:YggS family pyridoxal phosphate-dependent enzyme [Ruminococcus sp.]
MNEYDFVKENLKRILFEVGEAKAKYRSSDEKIEVMAVTKTVAPEIVNIAIENGITLLGENRVQEYLGKRDSYDKSARVDFIGHLQTNKVKYIIDSISVIQSVDSLRLAEEINRQSEKIGRVTDVYVEVNIGGEESKSGILPEETEEFIHKMSEYSNIRVCGMMTIPPKTDIEKNFSKMRQLFIDIRGKNIDNNNVCVLSMGMSADYTAAIKHGSNLVRIGSGLFGARKYMEG